MAGTLPHRRVPDGDRGGMSELVVAPERPHIRCSVLICDDQAEIRTALCVALAGVEHLRVVGQASNGGACLRLLPSTRPHVVILDVNMPEGGPGLAEKIKRLHPAAFVLAFSARQDEHIRRAMVEAGADAYLVKTGRLRPLLQLLRSACPLNRTNHVPPV